MAERGNDSGTALGAKALRARPPYVLAPAIVTDGARVVAYYASSAAALIRLA